jgi:uncharacterized protein DUF6600
MHRSHLIGTRIAAIGIVLLTATMLAGVAVEDARAETTVTIAYFDGALDPYGTWVEDPYYGRAWRPSRVSDDWRPYTRGSWVYTRDYGWVWASDEPYGWVVYHYGHWVWTDRYGWVWVAGYDWAPAWVEWCYGGGYVGWEPMPPDPYWQGAYYYGSYDCTSPAYYSRAVFVSETYFGRPGMSSHYEPSSRNAAAASATVNVTSYSRGRVGISNRSIDVRKLEAATGQPIKVLPVVQAKAPIAGAQVGAMQELQIFRPSVANLTGPKFDTPPSLRFDPAIPPAASTLDTPAAEPRLRPLESARRSPLDDTGPGSMSTPDLGRGMPDLGGGAAQSLPSPGGVFGGVHGVLGR